jgi:hypothetical protein
MGAPEVGPVLSSGTTADAVVLAIREENADVRVEAHAGYLRVCVPGRCCLSAAGVTRALGRPFVLPRDLELIMPSFKGKLRIDHSGAVWESPR